jgi:hypothetical protein
MKTSKLVTVQIVIWAVFAALLALAVLGALIAPVMVYGSFFLSGGIILVLAPLLLILAFVRGLMLAKKWAWRYGLGLLAFGIFFTLWQIGSSTEFLSHKTQYFSMASYSPELLNKMASLNIIVSVVILAILLLSLCIQLKLEKELTK